MSPSPLNTGLSLLPKLPASVCIVTNTIDSILEKIIHVTLPVCAEVLIGYDGDRDEIPDDFTGYKKVHIKSIIWEGYSKTKNNLAAAAEMDWILSLDGDEVPDERLLKELSRTGQKLDKHTIYAFKRRSIMGSKKIRFGAWGKDKVLRLYNRKSTHWKNDLVHENLEKNNTTRVVLLKGYLYHYTADNYHAFLEKNKKYARLSADKYFEQNKKNKVMKRWLSPVFTFIKEYIFQLGFLDGKAGLQIAWGNALYTYWKYSFLKLKY